MSHYLVFIPKKVSVFQHITAEYSHGLVNHVKTVNSPLNHCKHALTHHRLFRSVLKNADVLETVLYSFPYNVLPCAGQHGHRAARCTLQRNSHPI